MLRLSSTLSGLLLLLALLPLPGATASIFNSDPVLVGDIVSGQAVDHGTKVNCSVSVRVDRVLKGDVSPGETIAVAWQFAPMSNEGPEVTTKVAHAHALFFLHKEEGSDTYEALHAGSYPMPMGGYFLPVPEGPLHGPFLYVQGADFDAKLAAELGAALEAIAARDVEALDIHWAPPPYGGAAPPRKAPAEDLADFQALLLRFSSLKPQQAAEVTRYFASSPLAHLEAIGLLGELQLKDASAILALEANMDPLGLTDEAMSFGIAGNLDLHDKPAEVSALGRMAIAETAWFGFDQGAIDALVRADGLTAVPYLRVMLDHPLPQVRKTAREGIYATLARSGETVPEQGVAIKSWLTLHHPELPQLSAPSWYGTPAAPEPKETLLSPERRRELAFNRLLARLTIQSAPEALGLDLVPDDRQRFNEITTSLNQRLKVSLDAMQEADGAARLANKSPDPAVFCRHAAEVRRILSDGLAELDSGLSAAGRQSLDAYFARWPVHQYAAGTGSQWFTVSGSPVSCD